MQPLVSIDWLSQHIDDPDLIILDASLSTTVFGQERDALAKTIPNARYFDLKGDFSDLESNFPNTFPKPEQFEKACQKLGINAGSKIVIFDNKGIYISPRAWWMFKVMGHHQVAILNGGLPAWKARGLATQSPQSFFPKGDFKANFEAQFVIKYEDILSNIKSNNFLVVDARSSGRFKGIEPEPRKNLKSGHIPQSTNIPYSSLLKNGQYKSKKELKEIFESTLKPDQRLVFSCGSGITACIVLLAYELIGEASPYIYDGSWSEWAIKQGLTQ